MLRRELGDVVLQQRGEDGIAGFGIGLRGRIGPMGQAHAGAACESKQGFELCGGVGFGERFVLPIGERLVLQHGTGGGADVAVGAAEMRPGGGDGFGVLFAVEGFERAA